MSFNPVVLYTPRTARLDREELSYHSINDKEIVTLNLVVNTPVLQETNN